MTVGDRLRSIELAATSLDAAVARVAGDGVRQLARSFALPGDHYGQESRGYRWPYGSVAVITPFNFPLEIL